jgi:hypothetical protein
MRAGNYPKACYGVQAGFDGRKGCPRATGTGILWRFTLARSDRERRLLKFDGRLDD